MSIMKDPSARKAPIICLECRKRSGDGRSKNASWADVAETGSCIKCSILLGGVRVSFSNDIVTHEVTPYSECYAEHPRDFVFMRDGNIKFIKNVNRYSKTQFLGSRSRVINTVAKEECEFMLLYLDSNRNTAARDGKSCDHHYHGGRVAQASQFGDRACGRELP